MSRAKKPDRTVYSDDRYRLGKEDGIPYIMIGGRRYKLTCHPYEPCLYITDDQGIMTAVHNAFDPDSVLYAFSGGRTVTSITGREYDARDFCRMVEYASGGVNIQIDEAERVFGSQPKKKHPQPEKEKKAKGAPHQGEATRPGFDHVIENDPAYDVIAEYPDCGVDYCLVHAAPGCKATYFHKSKKKTFAQ